MGGVGRQAEEGGDEGRKTRSLPAEPEQSKVLHFAPESPRCWTSTMDGMYLSLTRIRSPEWKFRVNFSPGVHLGGATAVYIPMARVALSRIRSIEGLPRKSKSD